MLKTDIDNMLFRQIVREQAIPLSMSLTPLISALDDLMSAKAERSAGYMGRSLNAVIEDMEQIVAEVK